MICPTKPLGGKAYGSIGHLPLSRLGPGDHHVSPGQADICTVRARKGDRIVVTEKLDGACMSVANINGEIVALTRAGYRAEQGTWEHLRAFAPYVESRKKSFARLLRPGERVVGEWLALAHGTRYDRYNRLFRPFVAFDIFRDGRRLPYCAVTYLTSRYGIDSAACIHEAETAISIPDALKELGKGYHGAIDPPEGLVWRVERDGGVDFLAKYVRHDKADGAYLPNISGADPVWNWQMEAA